MDNAQHDVCIMKQTFRDSGTVSVMLLILQSRAVCIAMNEQQIVSKSYRTGRLERELQMVQLSATRCSCIAILWVSLLSFAAITHCIAFQWVFIVVSIQSGNFWIYPRKQTLSALSIWTQEIRWSNYPTYSVLISSTLQSPIRS
jgi:hypothetical protein